MSAKDTTVAAKIEELVASADKALTDAGKAIREIVGKESDLRTLLLAAVNDEGDVDDEAWAKVVKHAGELIEGLAKKRAQGDGKKKKPEATADAEEATPLLKRTSVKVGLSLLALLIAGIVGRQTVSTESAAPADTEAQATIERLEGELQKAQAAATPQGTLMVERDAAFTEGLKRYARACNLWGDERFSKLWGTMPEAYRSEFTGFVNEGDALIKEANALDDGPAQEQRDPILEGNSNGPAFDRSGPSQEARFDGTGRLHLPNREA